MRRRLGDIRSSPGAPLFAAAAVPAALASAGERIGGSRDAVGDAVGDALGEPAGEPEAERLLDSAAAPANVTWPARIPGGEARVWLCHQL